MAKSIIQTEKKCYICGSRIWLECHHVFFGSAYRKLSEKYGLKVWLCHWHHNEPPNGVHFNTKLDKRLREKVQALAMKHYGWDADQFRSIFGRNYI